MRDRKDDRGAGMTDAQLAALLHALKEKHRPIAEFIGAGAGIDLMNQDAMITAEIIRKFVAAGRPILTIHDSYIVMFGDDQRLREALRSAFEKVTGVATVHLKRSGVGLSDVMQLDAGVETRVGHGSLTHQHRTAGYLERLTAFYSS